MKLIERSGLKAMILNIGYLSILSILVGVSVRYQIHLGPQTMEERARINHLKSSDLNINVKY
jgi:hypothetical protein